jgi:exodeoxyribonuclease-5
VSQLYDNPLYCAPTGKAARRLVAVGCPSAHTLHSVLYRPIDHGDGSVTFTLHLSETLQNAPIVVVDEASMLSEKIGNDLHKFARRIVVVRDQFQLPPVSGGVAFPRAADYSLTKIHRQAAGNPIIQAATHVRTSALGQIPCAANAVGRCQFVPAGKLENAAAYADQILVGRNITRERLNTSMRSLLKFTHELPQVGDKLICVKNKLTAGFMNGGLWKVVDIRKKKKFDEIRVEDMDNPSVQNWTAYDATCLLENKLPNVDLGCNLFQYGYAITVHKAQGSQWDKVLLYDESSCFRESAARWLYTGITRAQTELYIT